MAKYISLDAVLTEIRKRKSEAERNCGGYKSGDEHLCDSCRVWQYEEFEKIIGTLEVKRVDLDEEIKSYFKGFGKFASVGIDDCIDIAKHFFELGMQVSNKAQKGE